jgi:nitrogen-specific signal transduction histidine kinase
VTRGWRSAERPRTSEPTFFAAEALERLPVPVAVFDHAGRLGYANPAFSASPLKESLLDRRLRVAHPDLERLRIEALRDAGHRETAGMALEASGQPSWVEVFPLSTSPGWTVVVGRNAPAPRPTEAPLPSPRLLLHELRAPLFALDEGLETLAQSAGSGELAEVVSRLSRAAARLRGVLQGISDLVRVDRLGAEGAPSELVDLREVLADVADTYSLLAAASGHELAVTTPAAAAEVRGDRELLGRAVGNLVDNAIRHTPPGTIAAEVALRGPLVVVEVADSGPGIPEEQRERIFEPFVRLDPADLAGAGSGLGLAVVRTIALAHGAGITVDRGPEGGAAFRLAFLARGSDRRAGFAP